MMYFSGRLTAIVSQKAEIHQQFAVSLFQATSAGSVTAD
jgi:hypothetical protein